MEVEPETEEFWQCFWDYFLFDYHLIADDKTPLQHFADNGKSNNLELVNELCKSRLAIFTVEEACEEGFYACKDFLTNEEYSLNLPLDIDADIKDMLVVGHIFYNKTMVMNYVRCFQINPIARKRLHASVAKRVAGLVFRAGVVQKVAMSGGVALNKGVVRALAKEIHSEIIILDDCQIIGALGAALYAYQEIMKQKNKE